MMVMVNLEYARKGEGVYYGDGTAKLAEAVALAGDAAKHLGPEAMAECVYAVLRMAARREGQDPDIETFMREEHGHWRVSWESGPYSWAYVASEALGQVGIFAEPHYSFDLCFYPED
jgi:hypothetical protein